MYRCSDYAKRLVFCVDDLGSWVVTVCSQVIWAQNNSSGQYSAAAHGILVTGTDLRR